MAGFGASRKAQERPHAHERSLFFPVEVEVDVPRPIPSKDQFQKVCDNANFQQLQCDARYGRAKQYALDPHVRAIGGANADTAWVGMRLQNGDVGFAGEGGLAGINAEPTIPIQNAKQSTTNLIYNQQESI